MKFNPFAVVVPALLALAACNAPEAAPVDETGTASEELSSQVRYIVHFGNDHAAGRAALNSAGAKVALELPSINAAAVTLPAKALAGLQNSPHFAFVEEDVPRYPMAQSTPYGITMTQVDQVWPTTTGGGKKVCIIDSGVNVNHEDLAGITFTGYNSGTSAWNTDLCGHGTHVTGTIAARNNSLGVVGVNTGGISIHMVKVFGDDCAWAYSSTLIDAAEHCLTAGANVVSMSLGGSLKSKAEENEFKKLATNGILSIAASGNAGTIAFSYPASYPIVVSVAAVDSNKAIATFSQHNREVDIAAPGVAVLSTVPWLSTASISVGAGTYNGGVIDGSASTTTSGVNGSLVDGGLCTAAGSWAGKVVLCQRGTNTFAEKVANAKAGGGIACVIYNNAPGGFVGTLNGTSTIPGISISQEDGQAIIAAGGVGQSSNVKSFTVKPSSGYEAWDGTSMATPHVSGIAALIWSAYPTKTATQVRTALEATGEDLGTAGRDDYFGNGLVRAKAALDYLGTH